MAEFIEFLSPKALEELQKANSELLSMATNVDKVAAKMKTVTTPSGANNFNATITKGYEATQKAAERARLAEIKLAQDREKAFDRYEAQLNREQTRLAAANSLYNQTQQKVNLLTKTYNELAIKKELGQSLSAAEITQLSKLTNEINIYQSALKKVDADIQKNQRNVGNYASGWNGLGNSINQLSREMPAFANSAQTGFMALSNNLPILFDEISRIKTANKELIAQGLPVKSVFSQIAGAVLSWGTALSVGVTLLTVFGPKLWDMVSGSKESKKAIEAETKAREEKSQVERQAYEQQIKYASDEQARAKILLETAKNLTLSLKEREAAVSELQKRYPEYLGLLSKEQILAGDTADQELRLNDALMKRAMFLAVQDKIVETTKKLVDAEMQYAETNRKAIETDNLYDETLQKKTATKQKYRLVNEEDLQTTKGLEAAVKNSDKTIKTSTTVYQEKTLAVKKQLDVLFSILNSYAKYNNVVVEDTKNTKKNTEAKKESIKIFTEDWFQSQISNLEKIRGKVADTTREYSQYTTQIDVLKMLLEQLQGKKVDVSIREEQLKALDEGVKKMKSFEENTENATDKTKKLKAATDDFINSFMRSFFSDAGLPSMFDILDGRLKEFGDNTVAKTLLITESFQEMYNFIDQMSQQNFDAQRQRLQQETEIALAFAGDSEAARDEINRQREEKERQIRKREFEAKKKQAIFNIAIDTAQAIMASYARLGFIAGFEALLIAGIGAAQIAAVNAQEIPAFKDGGTHKGGLMLVNDAKGSNYRETIKTPDGKIYQPKDRNVLMNAPAGTEIFTPNQWQKELDNILMSNQINYTQPNVTVNGGGMNDAQVDKIVSAVKNKQEAILNIDKNGFDVRIRKGHTTQKILNSQVTFGRE